LVENEDSEIDMRSLNEEFDGIIHELHRRLQFAKEERKKTQNEAKILQHRVNLLQNQEKLAQQRFEKTKNKFEQILEKRKFFDYSNKVSQGSQMMKNKRIEQLREQARNQREILKKSQSSQSFLSMKEMTSSSKDLRILQQIREINAVSNFNEIEI
jgi:hypothetical protein